MPRGEVLRPFLLGTTTAFVLLAVSCGQVSEECPTGSAVPGCPSQDEFKLQPLVLGPVAGRLPPPPTAKSVPQPVGYEAIRVFGPETSAGLPKLTPAPVVAPAFVGSPEAPGAGPAPATPEPTEIGAVAGDLPLPDPTPGATRVGTPPPVPAPVHIPTPTPVPEPVPTLVATPSAAVPAPDSTVTLVRQTSVRISLEVESRDLRVGEEFDVEVWIWASPEIPVDTAQVYLEFDSRLLEAVSITRGPDLEYGLLSTWDNGGGRLDYAAGTLGNPPIESFILCTATFRIRSDAGPAGTEIKFASLEAPRETKAVFGVQTSPVSWRRPMSSCAKLLFQPPTLPEAGAIVPTSNGPIQESLTVAC